MILTGKKIHDEQLRGRIEITPFDSAQLNPNSYNYRLGPILKESSIDAYGMVSFREIIIPDEGYVLKPRTLYLGHTLESIGSDTYAMSLIGRSSLGRLGMFLQVSANLGHTFSKHQWTLEIYAAHAIRVYPGMKVGQVSFWRNTGLLKKFGQTYARFNQPTASKGIPVPEHLPTYQVLRSQP